ncbi:hypothetical protein [Sulfurimonas sp.]|uniref:hypothetical protein n=1 Tax=Sulfurimonas sp. TaxID=2022749 RepID=UPI003563CDC6
MKKIKNDFTMNLISAFLVFGISFLSVSFFAVFKLNENIAFKNAKVNAQMVYHLKTFQFETYINDMVNELYEDEVWYSKIDSKTDKTSS